MSLVARNGAAVDIDEAYAYCRAVTRRTARNFYFAFITLPAKRRLAIYAAYAFCRMADDIADGEAPPSGKRAQLAALRQGLDRALAGEAGGPVFTALADTMRTYRVPQRLFHDVLDGVEMDLTSHRYETFDDLRAYCERVASAVGLVCIEVFGYRDGRARQAAVELGIAMQLTNILRDLKEDAGRGRVYLPQEDLRRFGYTEADLHGAVRNERFVALMRFQARRARGYFASGATLVPLVAWRSRSCPAVLHAIYRRLLDRMEQRGFDVFTTRARLSTGEKLRIMTTVWLRSLLPYRRA